MFALLKSILHNVGVLAVSVVMAFACTFIDRALGINIGSVFLVAVGWIFIIIGFSIRTWAAYHFYRHRMRVIVLHAQNTLIRSGPYAYSRNPLYIGGNVFMFFGASFLLGSLAGITLTALHLPLLNRMVKREERQLAHRFGAHWIEYARHVPRWY